MEQIDTKQIITGEFIGLLETKSMDQITVSKLAEVSNVSRQTFYYHFQDLTAVIEWYVDDRMQAILQQALTKTSYQSRLRYFLEEVENVYDPMRKILQSDRRAEIENMLFRKMNGLVDAIFQAQKLNEKLAPQEYEFFVTFCASGIAGSLIYYLNTGTYHIESIEEIIENILTILDQYVKK